MKQRWSMSLATKLSLAIALLVTTALGVKTVLTLTAIRTSLREQVRSANLMAATLAARAVDQYVVDATRIMQEASTRPKLRQEILTANWSETNRVLENVREHFPQFDWLFVLDAQGMLTVRVPQAPTVGQNFAFRDFFQEPLKTRRLYISGVYTSPATQRPVVTIAVPVLDPGDRVQAVLGGALSIQSLSRFVSAIGHEDGSLIYIVDRKGLLIAHSEGVGADQLVDVSGRSIVQQAMAGRLGSMEFKEGAGQEGFFGSHVPIARLGWGVVAAKPVSVANALASGLGRWLVGVAVGFIVAAVLLGWTLARTLTAPVRRLADATEKLGAGDLTVRVEAEGGDEIAALAASFNGMAGRLQMSHRDLERKAQEIETLNQELEQRIRDRTRELVAANKELEGFTYTVSHDLKAPLRGMDGYVTALAEDYGDRLDETGRRYLTMIQSAVRRMGELIEDLLGYSRLERREMKQQLVPLKPLVDQVCEDAADGMRARHLTLQLELEEDTVAGEPEGLRQALHNLVGNAVKFSQEAGGTITIGSRRENGAVVLSVADTGIGFDMKYHDRIFGIFERLHRQEDYPGTGVGLAIVRKVAERHGGRVWAVSQPGRGSTFYLALPESAR